MPNPKIHRIKVDEQWIDSILDGSKPFEIRLNDRNYQKGDVVYLQAYTGMRPSIPDRTITAQIGCVTSFKQREGYVVFGLLNIEEYSCDE